MISQGYCSTFAIDVPVPFFLQSLLGGFYPTCLRFRDELALEHMRLSLQDSYEGMEELGSHARDFVDFITQGMFSWWDLVDRFEHGFIPSFRDLDNVFHRKINEVSKNIVGNEIFIQMWLVLQI